MFIIGEHPPNVSTQKCVYYWQAFCVFTIVEHSKIVEIWGVCWDVGGDEGRGLGDVRMCGEGVETFWGMYGKVWKKCGEVCWDVGEVRKNEGRGLGE